MKNGLGNARSRGLIGASTLSTAFFWIGCGGGQDPAFKEERSFVQVALTVEDANATAGSSKGDDASVSPDEAAESLTQISDEELAAILGGKESTSVEGGIATQSANDDDDNQESLDAVAGVSGDGKGSADGKTSGMDVESEDDPSSGEDVSAGTGQNASASYSDGEQGPGSDSDTGNTSGDQGIGKPSVNEIRACARLNGVNEESVQVVHGQKGTTIKANSVVAVKVTGNQTELDLSLSGKSGIGGICVFIAGNQSLANIEIGARVGNLIYVARGNQSQGRIEVLEAGTVSNLVADLSGNRSALTVFGTGAYDCGAARTRGMQTSFVCN